MGASGADMGGWSCTPAHVQATQSALVPPAVLRVHADVSGVRPQWLLVHADDATVYHPEVSSDGFTATFEATLPGTWSFRAQFPGSNLCPGDWPLTLTNPDGKTEQLHLRALPPEGAFTVTEITRPLVGGTPRTDYHITLAKGVPVLGHVRAASDQTPVAGEIRFLAQLGADAVGHVGADGLYSVSLQESAFYRTLFIPDSPALAPMLDGQLRAPSGETVLVGAGEPVGGTITVAGTVTAGARVVLRSGDLPSGLGVSDAGGAYVLRAQAGDHYDVTVGGDALPEATLSDVSVPAGGLGLDVRYTVSMASVSGVVHGSSGALAGGARVTIRSPKEGLGPVAVITAGSAMRSADGRLNRVVTTDANGALPALSLPAGSYDVFVEPPGDGDGGGGGDGLTAFTLSAPGSWNLTLQPPIELAGRITSAADGSPVVGARVTASAQVGLGAAPSVFTDGDGRYRFTDANRIGAGTRSTLVVVPPVTRRLAGLSADVAAGTATVDLQLVRGIVVSGLVRGDGNLQKGVRVESLCTTCLSPVPQASSLTDDEGRYYLYLPDPGVDSPVDGGATD
jgi:hypothetical protein